MKGLAPIACLCQLSHAVYAYEPEPVVYVGASFSQIDYSEDNADLDFGVVSGKFGAIINEYLALELRYGVGIEDDSLYGVDVKVSSLMGGYLRVGMPVADKVYPYLVLGRSKGELEARVSGVSVEEDSSDFSYGLGANFAFPSSDVQLSVEYMRLFDKDSYEVDGVSIGLQLEY